MKKYLLFFPICIITFYLGILACIGSILAELQFSEIFKSQTPSPVRKNLDKIIHNPAVKNIEKKLTVKCSDRVSKLIWNEFQKEPKFTKQVMEWLKKNESADNNDSKLEIEKARTGENLFEIFIDCSNFLVVSPIDLDQDGVHEYFVKPNVSTSNFDLQDHLRIYKFNNDELEEIFRTNNAFFTVVETNRSNINSILKIWSIVKKDRHACESLTAVETYSFSKGSFRKISRKPDGILTDVADKVFEKEIFTKKNELAKFDFVDSNR